MHRLILNILHTRTDCGVPVDTGLISDGYCLKHMFLPIKHLVLVAFQLLDCRPIMGKKHNNVNR